MLLPAVKTILSKSCSSQKLLTRVHAVLTKRFHSGLEEIKGSTTASNNLIEFHGEWPSDERSSFLADMQIYPNFISTDEETKLFEEIEPYMKRLRYEFDHWDDAIHGYRETERKHWYPHNRQILDRVRNIAFDGEVMPYVHILDLDTKGVIKPHVDSTRYCGPIIAGISLLSDSVMRLVRTDEQKYKQNNDSEADQEESYRSQPSNSPNNNFYADLLLRRNSLYIMSNTARYNFTHEILSNEKSLFGGEKILKNRRISIICRNEP